MEKGTTYVDNRSWRYQVQPGIGNDAFKGHYWTPERCTWHCMRQLPWRKSFEEAQADLDAYARKKHWLDSKLNPLDDWE